jgi:hypothetical protein
MSRECKICKETLTLDKFRNNLKACKKCNYNKSKCEHGKEKKKCRPCGGSGLCEHDKQKYNCTECNSKLLCGICRNSNITKNSKFFPLCEACYCSEYPDSPLSINYKTKEKYLFDELKLKFNNISMRINKTIDNGCSNRRPDILIDKLIFSIVIECDEKQHQGYDCEDKRTMEIFQDLGNRPLVLIRFNPDSYTTNGIKIEGCFENTKIHQKKFYNLIEYEWLKRLTVLEDTIKKYLNMEEIPSKEVTIEKLFYDGFVSYSNKNILGTIKAKNNLNNSYIINSYIDSDLNINLYIIKDGTYSYIKVKNGEVISITKEEFELLK